MRIELSVDNKFLNLCKLDISKMDESGKEVLDKGWNQIKNFMEKSNFPGKNNLIVTLRIDGNIIFDKVKVKYKDTDHECGNVFYLFEKFLLDKIYFYKKLEKDERTDHLTNEFIENQMNLLVLKRLNSEMRFR